MTMFAPTPMNQTIQQDSYSADTAWHVVASDGTGYASVALMAAAGKTAWPSLGVMSLSSLETRSINAGADGSAFQIAFNHLTAPSFGKLVSGSGQTVVLPGNVYNVWIAKTVAADLVELVGMY